MEGEVIFYTLLALALLGISIVLAVAFGVM